MYVPGYDFESLVSELGPASGAMSSNIFLELTKKIISK